MTSGGGLQGQAFLITGGGSGIGYACAAALAADGATVTICGRTEEKLAAAADALGVRYVVADVTAEDDVRRAVETAAEPTGALDGCVASAGGGGMLAPLHQQSVEDFRR